MPAPKTACQMCKYIEDTGALFEFNRLDQIRLMSVGKGRLDLLG